MIKRSNDFNCFNDDIFNNLKNIIENKSKLIDIVDDENTALNKQKELNIMGQNSEIVPFGSKFKIVAKKQEMLDLREAKNSGMFKKLAWGRYYFTKENKLGDKSYDFDDGSIWKVIKGEDGVEYLTKEVDENEEVIRCSNDYLTDDNYKKFASILNIDTKTGSVLDMMITSNMQKEMNKFINTQLETTIANKIAANNYIQSKDYNNEIKELVITSINNDIINKNEDIDKLIKEYTEKQISKTNNFSIF